MLWSPNVVCVEQRSNQNIEENFSFHFFGLILEKEKEFFCVVNKNKKKSEKKKKKIGHKFSSV